MDSEAAARLFSISVESGTATVQPDVPMFLRMPLTVKRDYFFDESFLHGECVAALLAAATLTKSPVLNRPYKGCVSGRAVPSAGLTQLRLGMPVRSEEVFSNTVPAPSFQVPRAFWSIQDLVTFSTNAWPSLPSGDGPYRAKWLDFEPSYEVVTVLGHEAWRSTTVKLEHLGLESRSIELIKRLELLFAAVTWEVSPALDSAELARVDPYPSFSQVQPVWTVLGEALLRHFFQ
jgi:hypothetical protein